MWPQSQVSALSDLWYLQFLSLSRDVPQRGPQVAWRRSACRGYLGLGWVFCVRQRAGCIGKSVLSLSPSYTSLQTPLLHSRSLLAEVEENLVTSEKTPRRPLKAAKMVRLNCIPHFIFTVHKPWQLSRR